MDRPVDTNHNIMKPSGRIGDAPLTKVSQLIDAYTGRWNVDLIQQNFTPNDAIAILNIPLRVAGGEDTVAWALKDQETILSNRRTDLS